MLHREKISIISIIHFNNHFIIKRITMIDSFLKRYLSCFYQQKQVIYHQQNSRIKALYR